MKERERALLEKKRAKAVIVFYAGQLEATHSAAALLAWLDLAWPGSFEMPPTDLFLFFGKIRSRGGHKRTGDGRCGGQRKSRERPILRERVVCRSLGQRQQRLPFLSLQTQLALEWALKIV